MTAEQRTGLYGDPQPIDAAAAIIAERHGPIFEAILQRMAGYDLGEVDFSTDAGCKHGIELALRFHRDMVRLHSQAARELDQAVAVLSAATSRG